MSIGKTIIASRIIHMLMTPFEETQAYKYGIIDRDGNIIKSPESTTEKSSIGPLERLVFSLKKIISKSSLGMGQIVSLSTAYHIFKESKETDTEEVLEEKFDFFMENKIFFPEEEMEIKYIVEEIAANNTAGVEVKNPDAVPQIKKKTVKDLLARRSGK